MKKRAAKKKVAPKPKRAAKPSAARSAAKVPPAPRTSRPASYTPSPLKSDGWPPFRYPVQ
jgi:hypothetical protein